MGWLGHVLRRGADSVVGRVLTMEVVGARGRRRSGRQRKDVIENDIRVIGLEKGMAAIWRLGEDKSIDCIEPPLAGKMARIKIMFVWCLLDIL